MGLITDVKHEVAHLEVTPKSLRKFGLLVGSVFLFLAWVAWRKHWAPALGYVFVGVGSPLLLLGAVAPVLLRSIYVVWMTFSLSLGWFMSRVILTILFVLVLVPIGLLGRLIGLPFVKLRRPLKQDSYWVDHPARAANHHEEMF